MRKRHHVMLALAAAVLLTTAVFFFRWDLAACLHDLEALRDWVLSFSPWSEAVFFLLQLSSVIVAPIPSNLMATAGGMCFGFRRSCLLTIPAVTLGSCLTFTLARTLGKSWAERLMNRKLPEKYRSLLRRKRDSFLFLAFLFPFFPDDLLCIVAGLTDIPPKRFLILVVLARPWGLLTAAGLGASLPGAPSWALGIMAAGGAALFALGLKYGDVAEERILSYLANTNRK